MTTAPPAWRNRIVGHGEADPAALVANPSNWRTHPASQRSALRGSLDTVGWVAQVLVNQATGHVVDGHARIEEAIGRNEHSVPVVYVDLTPEEEDLVLATLDPIGAMAKADKDQLEALLRELTPDDPGLGRLIEDLAREYHLDLLSSGLIDPDAAPETPDEPYVEAGELYALGEHRLLCGDATSAADVGRLMAGETARAMVTDPPWNVAIGKDSNPRHRQREGLVNDDLSEADFAAFLHGFADLAHGVVSGDVYCVLGAAEWPTLDLALRDAGFHWSATIIWVKQQFVLGRSNFHRRYEPMWYGWRIGEVSSYTGDRTADDVWEIDRPYRSPEHPTMKPVALYAKAIGHSTHPGDIVFDPFVGSGTAVIAAEQTRRRAYVMEIDPRYAQVTIERWQAFTGRAAERIDE